MRKTQREILDELRALYQVANEDNAQTLVRYMRNKRSASARMAYFESCQRVGTLIEVFEVLGIADEIPGNTDSTEKLEEEK